MDFSAMAAPTMRRTLSAVMASVNDHPLALRAAMAAASKCEQARCCTTSGCLDEIQADVARMREIVIHLRALANPERPNRVRTDLNQVVVDVLPLLQREASTREQKETIWHEILDLHAEQIFSIGIVSGARQPVVVNKNLNNETQILRSDVLRIIYRCLRVVH